MFLCSHLKEVATWWFNLCDNTKIDKKDSWLCNVRSMFEMCPCACSTHKLCYRSQVWIMLKAKYPCDFTMRKLKCREDGESQKCSAQRWQQSNPEAFKVSWISLETEPSRRILRTWWVTWAFSFLPSGIRWICPGVPGPRAGNGGDLPCVSIRGAQLWGPLQPVHQPARAQRQRGPEAKVPAQGTWLEEGQRWKAFGFWLQGWMSFTVWNILSTSRFQWPNLRKYWPCQTCPSLACQFLSY